MFIPSSTQIEPYTLIRSIDVFSSIEHFFTRFFGMTRIASLALGEIHVDTNPIFPLLEEVSFSELSPKKTDSILKDMTNRAQNLLRKYYAADKILEEAWHAHNDATHLVNGITSPSAYSEFIETRLSDKIEGAAESIGRELQIRLPNITTLIPRSIGRSYNIVSSVSNLINSQYERLLNKTMVNYTKTIKVLTIVIVILTVIITGLSLISLSPDIRDYIFNHIYSIFFS